jgi:ABC-type Fe3+-siderophore transport system permease subunit
MTNAKALIISSIILGGSVLVAAGVIAATINRPYRMRDACVQQVAAHQLSNYCRVWVNTPR